MPNSGGNMYFRPTTGLKPSLAHGFTLVELMVTVAVMGILAIIAMPSMAALVTNSRVSGQTEELVASLQLARAEAIRRNARVTVCAGTGGVCSGSATWNGWTIFGRDNINGIDDTIRDTTASASMQVTGPTGGIVYRPSGMIDTQQTLQVDSDGNMRCLAVLVSGVVTVTKGACP